MLAVESFRSLRSPSITFNWHHHGLRPLTFKRLAETPEDSDLATVFTTPSSSPHLHVYFDIVAMRGWMCKANPIRQDPPLSRTGTLTWTPARELRH